MEWKFDNQKPIYAQIVDVIRLRIITGRYEPGSRLPSVRELAGEASVNPNTMQRALTELEREGLLLSRRTSGRFVTEDVEKIRCLKTELAEDAADKFKSEMARLGFTEQEIIDFFLKRCEKAERSVG